MLTPTFKDSRTMKNATRSLIAAAIATAALSVQTNPPAPTQSGAGRFTVKRIPLSAVHHGQTASPRLRIRESTSSNWSGYAVPMEGTPGDTFASVSGSWTIPAVTGGSKAAYSSSWVGLDGYNDGTVEQTGTEQDWTGRAQNNYVWFEMYPSGAYEIEGFPINPGDVFTASVTYVGTTSVRVGFGRFGGTQTEYVFTVTIANTTRGVSYTVPASYTTVASAARGSAEWVEEAPSSYRGVLPIADFGTVNFSGCYATSAGSGGEPAAIGSGVWTPDPLTMADGTSGISTPSGLSDGGTAFSVTWSP